MRYTLDDFATQEVKRNPYPFFSLLRETEPLYRFTLPNGLCAWMVTRYDDALAILKDPLFCKDARKVFPADVLLQLLPESLHIFERHLLFSDAPAHTRLRNLVASAFARSAIEQLRPRIQQFAHELIDNVQQQGWMEVMNDFAFPLPLMVIAELLGVPQKDLTHIRHWMSVLLSRASDLFMETDVAFPAEIQAMTSYLSTLIAHKREQPAADVISSLVQAEEAGEKLSEEELTAMVYILIVAGYETTANLIGNAILVLLSHPEQMLLLRCNPAALKPAVEEILRYTAPVATTTQRWCSEEKEIRGQLLQKGDLVFISLIAANTDPLHFHQPEQFDILRQNQSHLAFGKGIHSCLGASLARLEGQIALETLLSRLPNLHLGTRPERLTWRPHLMLRGLNSLPVLF